MSARRPPAARDERVAPAPRAQRRLIRRVVVALAVAIGGSAAISGLVSTSSAGRMLDQLARDETTSFGEILAYEVTRNYELADERGLAGFIEGVRRRRPEVVRIRIADAQGKIVASSDEGDLGTALADDRFAPTLAGNPVAPRFLGVDEETVSALVPLRIGRGKGAATGVLAVDQSQTALHDAFRRSRNVNLALAALMALLSAAGLGWYLERRVVRPIKELAQAARRMAARDLTGRPPEVDTGDELAELQTAFAAVGETTRGLLAQLARLARAMGRAGAEVGGAAAEVRSGAAAQRTLGETTARRVDGHIGTLERLGAAAREAVARADKGGQAARDIATASNELVGVAVTANGDVAQSVEAIRDVAVALRRILEAADGVRQANDTSSAQAQKVHQSGGAVRTDAGQAAELALELAGDAVRGAEAVARVVVRIRDIDERIRTVDKQMEILNPALGRILGIAHMVGEIADQTRVLSLNASILAARAGEAGAGFQVVAERVRQLSALTRSSTAEISELVGSVEKTAPAVLETVRSSRAGAAEGVTLAERAAQALERILSGSTGLRGATARIAEAASEQVESSQRLMASTLEAVKRVDQLTEAAEAQRTGTERLERNGEALRGAAQSVDGKARRQEQLAEGIVAGARIDAERLHALGSAALDGVSSSRELQESTQSIVEVGGRHVATLDKFDEVLAVLSSETASLGEAVASFRLPTGKDPGKTD